MTNDPAPGLLSISPRLFHTLRRSLERNLGERAAQFLQEAGYASGSALYDSFGRWLKQKTSVLDPAELDQSFLSDMLSEFLADRGWGQVVFAQLGDATMAMSSNNWAESDPECGTKYPACHVTTGLLADFFTRLADNTVAVMEVECRSRGDSECRFLMGSPETLQVVYEFMTEGRDYTSALTAG
ncbi:MAG: V4R domain-containing protein [Gemmatimonadales bacterium]